MGAPEDSSHPQLGWEVPGRVGLGQRASGPRFLEPRPPEVSAWREDSWGVLLGPREPCPGLNRLFPTPRFLAWGGGGGGGYALFLPNRERSQAQSLATWFPTPSSSALLHFTPILLMQEEYQEYEPEA